MHSAKLFFQLLLVLVVGVSALRQPFMPRTTVECTGGQVCASVVVGANELPPCCQGEHAANSHCIIRSNPRMHFIFSKHISDVAAPVALLIPGLYIEDPHASIPSEPLAVLPLRPQLTSIRSMGPRAPPTCA